MKKRLFKRGQKFGKWTLEIFLGGGGNGEVWKCKDDSGNIGAIKLLKTVKPKSYARFVDETTVIKKNSDINGIIPIIDDFLPTKLNGEIPFYVMPVAASAEKALIGKSIEEKIDAIIEICQTLKDLHKRGISHRDIKPPNFLVYQSRFSIADFGLVDYPEKKDISFNNEEIGAKWTMAPEMRRESSSACGLKADIYSIAKTIWIILTENTKGFDGQYSTESVLELRRFYPNKYTTPIDSLLAACTDNDPNSRPDIENVILTLEDWKVLNEDFHERNQEQWFEIQRKLFPTAFPQRVIWEDLNDIVNVLKVLCTYDSLNHMFYPGGGGMDLEDARLANEKGCIELDFQVIEIVKPKRLMFESFGFDPQWNYFRLELDELEPTGIYETEEGEEPYEIKYDHESVTELYPGQYGKYDMAEYRSEYIEMGYDIPENARQVSRWFRGSFVIFNKRSIYNLTPDTYDGRHNKVNSEQFRKHIQNTVDMFKEQDAKKSMHEKIMERINSKRRKQTVHNSGS
ncbi:protein kinase domain-containing protein [Marinifilum fragile]|uniref:protein kinase domain-containing protein n=1 Tax=Marinifilum fragile TaxID=570161 RepID=UPI002AA722E1|nr:protein kinase [Marinifilum fragile]